MKIDCTGVCSAVHRQSLGSLHRTALLHLEQVAQVDLGVHEVRDLPLVEEARQVGLHFGASGDAHAQREEAAQVLLHRRLLVSIQTLLPGLLGLPAFL